MVIIRCDSWDVQNDQSYRTPGLRGPCPHCKNGLTQQGNMEMIKILREEMRLIYIYIYVCVNNMYRYIACKYKLILHININQLYMSIYTYIYRDSTTQVCITSTHGFITVALRCRARHKEE